MAAVVGFWERHAFCFGRKMSGILQDSGLLRRRWRWTLHVLWWQTEDLTHRRAGEKWDDSRGGLFGS